MHVPRQGPQRIILIVTALSLIGCGTRETRHGMAPLAPDVPSTPGAALDAATAAGPSASDPTLTRVVLPFDPAAFVGGVQNPYFPLVPGTTLSYRQETPDGVETNTVEMTHDTRMILGVRTTIVHDRVYLNGSLKEDTFDWYAPDRDGNVWYFGEDTRELGPPVSTKGSWEAGKDGAQAGIIMLAHPRIGDTYYQENAPGVVADQARVKSLDESAATPYGTFDGCIKTQEWTPLEPGNRAFKLYAPGFGTVLEIPNHGGGPVELTAASRP